MSNSAGIITNLNVTLCFVSCGSVCGVNTPSYTSMYSCAKFSLSLSTSETQLYILLSSFIQMSLMLQLQY